MREQVKNKDIVRVCCDALVSVSWKLCSPIIAAFTSTLIFCALCDFALFANHLHILGTNRLCIFVCAYESLFVGTYRAAFHACTFDWLIGCFSIVEKSNFFLWSPLWVGCRLGRAHCKDNIWILKEGRKRAFSLAGQGSDMEEEKGGKTRGKTIADESRLTWRYSPLRPTVLAAFFICIILAPHLSWVVCVAKSVGIQKAATWFIFCTTLETLLTVLQ